MGRATSKGNEAKLKMKHPSDMPHAEIRTQVVVICGPTRYQLERLTMKSSYSESA